MGLTTIRATVNTVIHVHCTYPPSVNAIWRHTGKRVYRTPQYMSWLTTAGQEWLVQRAKLKVKSIQGPFRATIILVPPDKRKRDVDNPIKALLDLAKHLQITGDDSLCWKVSAEWGFNDQAPMGCCLILESVQT